MGQVASKKQATILKVIVENNIDKINNRIYANEKEQEP